MMNLKRVKEEKEGTIATPREPIPALTENSLDLTPWKEKVDIRVLPPAIEANIESEALNHGATLGKRCRVIATLSKCLGQRHHGNGEFPVEVRDTVNERRQRCKQTHVRDFGRRGFRYEVLEYGAVGRKMLIDEWTGLSFVAICAQ